MSITLLEHAILQPVLSVHASVCHTCEPWLHGSRYRNAFHHTVVSGVVALPEYTLACRCTLWGSGHHRYAVDVPVWPMH